MATINLGKIGFGWKSEYNPLTVYKVQDIVSYNGSTWVCIADGTVGVTPDSDISKWELFARGVFGIATQSGSLIYYNGFTLIERPPGQPGQSLVLSPSNIPTWGNQESRAGVKVKSLLSGNNASYRRNGCIMLDGSVRFWGNNAVLVHGTGTLTNPRSYPVRAGFSFGFPGASKIFLSYHAVARCIDTGGKLWQWGLNTNGPLGTTDVLSRSIPTCISDIPTSSLFGKTVVDVAHILGTEGGDTYMSSIVRCSDGTLHSCGFNTYGQLGQGDVTARNNFTQIATLTNITWVGAARERYTSCYALNDIGKLYTWGYNNEYQLGDATQAQRNTPILQAFFDTGGIALADVYPVYLGCFARTADGALYYWGTPSYGNAGLGSTAARTTPVLTDTNVRSVWVSNFDYQFTFIIKNDNTVWAAGHNGYGQLGVNNTTQQNSWVQVTGLPTNIVKIVCGGTASYGYSAFLTADGKVYTCGYNGNGQLGLGDVTQRLTPQLVPIAGRTVVDIQNVGASSEGGLSFLLDDGQMLQTGYAGESQLPDQASINSYTPYPVVF